MLCYVTLVGARLGASSRVGIFDHVRRGRRGREARDADARGGVRVTGGCIVSFNRRRVTLIGPGVPRVAFFGASAMWRAAKRAAEAAVRSAGRGSTASSSRANAVDISAIGRVVRDGAKPGGGAGKPGTAHALKGKGGGYGPQNPGCARRDVRHDRPGVDTHKSGAKQARGDQRRRSMHAEGLLELRHLWELEAAAVRNAQRRANGESPTTTAFAMVTALRHAGLTWIDIATHAHVRQEATHGAAHVAGLIASTPSRVFNATGFERAARRSVHRLTSAIPTLALRHAGGSWQDVVSHPAFTFLGRERNDLCKALFARGPTVSVGGVAGAATARLPSVSKPGPRFPEITEEIGAFISSSAALRHAGCSWLDVAKHASFHACVRARVVGGAYGVYIATFVKHPFTTAICTSVTKCVASDIFVQKVVEGRDTIDTKRVVCFFVLGLTYVGAFQYGLYNRLMKPVGDVLTKRWGAGASVGLMVFADQALVCPLLYLPTFFGLKTWANGECTSLQLPGTIARKSQEAVVGGANGLVSVVNGDLGGEIVPTAAKAPADSGWLTLFALWAYWVPAQAVNFWVVPRHLTIPFMNVMGFGWNGIMSVMNGGTGATADAEVDQSDALVIATLCVAGEEPNAN